MEKTTEELINERLVEIRELNNQENELINNRFTWMGVIEGLLITAYVTVLNKFFDAEIQYGSYLWVLLVLSSLGILISISFNQVFSTARSSLKKLKDRFFELMDSLDKTNDLKVPMSIAFFCDCKDKKSICENRNQKESKLDPWFLVPKIFIGTWSLFFLLAGVLTLMHYHLFCIIQSPFCKIIYIK
ncbi:MAG: hypothetical protein M0P13_02325 [Fibrobacteraceae bacterium]|nr:hypothetical protein [Fibrobacteraceae bacterium]